MKEFELKQLWIIKTKQSFQHKTIFIHDTTEMLFFILADDDWQPCHLDKVRLKEIIEEHNNDKNWRQLEIPFIP